MPTTILSFTTSDVEKVCVPSDIDICAVSCRPHFDACCPLPFTVPWGEGRGGRVETQWWFAGGEALPTLTSSCPTHHRSPPPRARSVGDQMSAEPARVLWDRFMTLQVSNVNLLQFWTHHRCTNVAMLASMVLHLR